QQDVVPSVADTKNGISPLALSSSIACLSGAPRNEKLSSVSRILSFTNAIIAAFSTHECALVVRDRMLGREVFDPIHLAPATSYLFGTVSDQFREQDPLVGRRVLLSELLDRSTPGCKQRDQNAVAGGTLRA